MSARQTSAKAIFLQALELITVAEREAYLDTQCGSNTELRHEIEELLRHEASVDGFLESPPTAVAESAEQLRATAPAMPSLAFLTPSSRADSLGRLGHYEILEIVGSGGMGIVLKAFDEQLHRIVAIKAMNPALAACGAGRQRFVREAQAAAAVNHDNVVDIYAVEEAGPVPYLVMEYVAGISLEEKLKQQGFLSLREILRIGLQTADGLAAAHRQGLVHRDVKPANILLQNGVERVKITDFGLARATEDVSVTQMGVIAGTPAYMSPEQARGEAVDHRSDLFSLGSVLYALCTGKAPFRSSTSLGMLQRVCEEEARSIRDLNADIPAWLCTVIEKLHAKLPAERFQSAAEVAETFGRFLAHLQQPALPMPTTMLRKAAAEKPAMANIDRRRQIARRRWMIAAVAALMILGATLSLTDASGITQVAATFIRILTPNGTLVVETNDPGVKVTVEGDGGLTITGAGLEAIRLRPGSYKVHADKDGKPVALERELVSIAKGGREVVRVKLEGTPAPAAATSEKGAFVLLAAGKERDFETLAQAVQGASDGDIIEIRTNGPFVTQPVNIRKKGLTIRAATNVRPVIKGTADRTSEVGGVFYLLHSQGPLVLEGLELHLEGRAGSTTVYSVMAPLHVANCRFVLFGGRSLFADAPNYTVRNCEFVGGMNDGYHVVAKLTSNGKIILENNLLSGSRHVPLELVCYDRDLHNVTIHLEHNTVVWPRVAIIHGLMVVPESAEPGAAPDRQPVQMHVSANLFESINPAERLFSLLLPPDWYDKDAKPISAHQAEELLPRLLAWREQRNLYCTGLSFQLMRRIKDQSNPEREIVDEPLPAGQTLGGWQRMWKAGDSGSVEGGIRYEGGDVLAKMEAAPERITAVDFRLRADSAGYHAGPGGKDLGADVDLVGPGPAYERWKKTPEYQQWLRDTKQVPIDEAAQPEPNAAARELAKWQGEWENAEYGRSSAESGGPRIPKKDSR